MIIHVNAQWKDTKQNFEATCYVGNDPCDIDDDLIFYYFEDGEEIAGDHGDFIVADYETV